MPTFTLPDPYDGWSKDKLKERIRELARAMTRDQLAIAMMVEYAPAVLDRLPAQYRERAKLLNAAYRDDQKDDAEAAAAGINVIQFD